MCSLLVHKLHFIIVISSLNVYDKLIMFTLKHLFERLMTFTPVQFREFHETFLIIVYWALLKHREVLETIRRVWTSSVLEIS